MDACTSSHPNDEKKYECVSMPVYAYVYTYILTYTLV